MIYTIDKLDKNINLKTDNLIIGFFDGIHVGHNKLFKNEGKTTVLTFNFFKKNTKQIFPLKKRIQIIQELYNPENIIIFDLEKINISAEQFINVFLKKWAFKKIVIGSDFKFGKDQKDVNYLRNFFNIDTIERNEDDVSTSLIKLKLMSGEIEAVNKLLLVYYSFTSIVVDGNKLGRELGYPTANFIYDDSYILPSDGVYITKTVLDNKEYKSLTFLGVPKTINGITNKQFETYILDYDGEEFYGKEITVFFFKKIDIVKKYNSLNDLVNGIKKQVELARKYFLKN